MLKKTTFSILTLLIFATISFAQIGINTGYNVNNAIDWKVKHFNNNEVIANFYTSGMSYGVDYWFRLKNYRVEFTPEINFSTTSVENTFLDINLKSTVSTFSFFANTNFYIFEFTGDCNCPTFSKPGLELEKGFFIRLSPGITYFTGELTRQGTDLITEFEDNNSLSYNIGVGIGLDLGISDFITITPIITYRYYFKAKWENLPKIGTGIKEWIHPTETTDISQIYAGVRLGIRFDYRK